MPDYYNPPSRPEVNSNRTRIITFCRVCGRSLTEQPITNPLHESSPFWDDDFYNALIISFCCPKCLQPAFINYRIGGGNGDA